MVHRKKIKLFVSQSNGNEIENAVKMAIDAGYRLIDTAWAYGNEAAIGKAVRAKIAQGVIKRSDIFIVTKVSLFGVVHSKAGRTTYKHFR